ncbi:MAG: hypothetical protein ACRDOI_44455, partial [Trebonia sp.]
MKCWWWRRVAGVVGLGAVLLAGAGCAQGPAAGRVKALMLHERPQGPARGPARVALSRARTADRSRITIARFSGAVTYVLHDGSADPGNLLPATVQAGPKITGASRARLLAAFNGG